jgi:hypothetical protein
MAVLRVGVVPGPGSADVAQRLRERDESGLLDVALAEQPTGTALVIVVGEAAGGEGVADVVLDAAAPVLAQADRLRAAPAGRRAYEAAKDKAARDHAADPDFDDYTRAKGAFFDDVQHLYERAAVRPRLGEGSSGS